MFMLLKADSSDRNLYLTFFSDNLYEQLKILLPQINSLIYNIREIVSQTREIANLFCSDCLVDIKYSQLHWFLGCSQRSICL